MDPELECMNPKSQKSDGYGPLSGGTIVRGSLGYCRRYVSEILQVPLRFPIEHI
jgi:exosome complex component RRP40